MIILVDRYIHPTPASPILSTQSIAQATMRNGTQTPKCLQAQRRYVETHLRFGNRFDLTTTTRIGTSRLRAILPYRLSFLPGGM